jgi:transaldolase
MKLFLDTANLDELRQETALGIIDGVTTNPSLLAKEGVAPEDQIRRICEIVKGDVSAPVMATEATEMVREGRRFAAIASNVVVKVPLTREGIAAVAVLAKENIRTNVTLCFSAAQALLAAKAGASMVSPFIGRVDDLGWPGVKLVEDIVTIYRNYGYKTELLAASIRGPLHLTEAAKAGAHIATLSPKVFHQLFLHPLTNVGLEQFLRDHKESFEAVGA